MPFFDPSKLRPREIAPGARIRTMWGERIMVSMVDLEPGSVVPAHTHPHEQMGVVLEGEFHMRVGGEERLLKPGDVYLVPSNMEHSVTVGATRAQVADLFSPPREDYMQA
ncbi:MAG: cupin domain-containing protein [Armatimonadetes bacterium]|nr:cupin domain-containing protein [Armatimonadota bacterium]